MAMMVSTLAAARRRSRTTSSRSSRWDTGRCARPGDEGFDANPIYNAMHVRRPALKVRPTGTADVVERSTSPVSGTCWLR